MIIDQIAVFVSVHEIRGGKTSQSSMTLHIGYDIDVGL